MGRCFRKRSSRKSGGGVEGKVVVTKDLFDGYHAIVDALDVSAVAWVKTKRGAEGHSKGK